MTTKIHPAVERIHRRLGNLCRDERDGALLIIATAIVDLAYIVGQLAFERLPNGLKLPSER